MSRMAQETLEETNVFHVHDSLQHPPCFRNPHDIMYGETLGAFHASYISFSRSLTRTMIREKWRIQKTVFDLNENGFGKVVYRVDTMKGVYHAVFCTQYLDPSLRNDRVIAEAWDMTCTLWNGEIRESDIRDLLQNAPLQEKGRYCAQVISISRANKSVRLFEYIVNCLAQGFQPSAEKLKSIGYVARTTAVYGNGKFGMGDYLNLLHTDFRYQFRVQMFVVYLIRQFTLDWVHHIAQCRNPKKAVTLSHNIAQFLGIGNSTGLGMVPYLIKHPHVVHTWIMQREQALYEIMHCALITEEHKKKCIAYITKGIAYFSEWNIPDAIQQQKNMLLIDDLKKMRQHIDTSVFLSDTVWHDIWNHKGDSKSQYSHEMQELFLNILMEIYPEISRKYECFTHVSDPFPCIGALSLCDVVNTIEKNFDWAIRVDYEKKDNSYFFWYQSEEKAEPRLGERYVECGADKELKIDIGRRIHHLYHVSKEFLRVHKHATVAGLLLEHPKWSGEIRRVVNYVRYPYGEIRENILSKELYPIDILRVKLAFFGAVKFDPKSDKWLRVTLFQGAPLLDSRGYVRSNDDWFLYRYEDAV